MQINTIYSLDNPVWTLSSFPAQRIVKCTTCESTGSVSIQGDVFVCPKCIGKAKHPQHAGKKWFISHDNARVGQVRAEITGQVYEREDTFKIQYMLDVTGVGSGTIWNEDDLFTSREAAQIECDIRNANLLTDEA